MIWQLEQLSKLHDTDPGSVELAIDELFDEKPDLREKAVIGAYLDDQINLGKAAELLGLHPLELREQLLDRGVPVKIGIESSDRGRAEARAYASTLTLLDACDKLGFRGGRARYHLVTWL